MNHSTIRDAWTIKDAVLNAAEWFAMVNTSLPAPPRVPAEALVFARPALVPTPNGTGHTWRCGYGESGVQTKE